MKRQKICLLACLLLSEACNKSDKPAPYAGSGVTCDQPAPEDDLKNSKPHLQMRQKGDTLGRKWTIDDEPTKGQGLSF